MGKKIILVFFNDMLITLGLHKLFSSFHSKHKINLLVSKISAQKAMEIWWKSGSKRLSVSTQLGENSDREYRLGVATRKGGKKGQKGAV